MRPPSDPADPRFRYPNGDVYRLPVGRHAPKRTIIDHMKRGVRVLHLEHEQPSAAEFMRQIRRELKIRFYQRRTIKSYTHALLGFLRWIGLPPHEATQEDVRAYLELLVDGGASSSWVSVTLSAIRTCFDKMCFESLTLGLVTPRRPQRIPVVLSPNEVLQLLKAAPSFRDKLLLGTMYATGIRVSEVVRLRWRDIDFERKAIMVREGKGRKDRLVMLPQCFEPMLERLSRDADPSDPVFPSGGRDPMRYIGPRTAERIMERAVKIANLAKHATPHSLRHSFATHMLENGTDIRFIQRFLGHVRLETTTLYTKVARLPEHRSLSPLDILVGGRPSPQPASLKNPLALPSARSLGRLRIELSTIERGAGVLRAHATLEVIGVPSPTRLAGLIVSEPRPGWITLDVPPAETWEEPLSGLSPEQRERFSEPEFFHMLQVEITKRFVAMKAGLQGVEVRKPKGS